MKLFFVPIVALLFNLPLGRPEVPSNVRQVVQLNGICTAFIAADNILFTAAHCIRGRSAPQEVRFYDGLKADFTVVAMGAPDHTDWAILRGNTRGIPPAEFSKSLPDAQTICTIVGHGGGRAAQYSTPCEVREPLRPPWSRYVALHANAIPGDSGAPVYDSEGRVFAILVRSSYPVPTGLGVDVRLARKALPK